VRELTVKAMLQGDFGRAFTSEDNSTSVSTDTAKNVVSVRPRSYTWLDGQRFWGAQEVPIESPATASQMTLTCTFIPSSSSGLPA
jgi:hypothetical protein